MESVLSPSYLGRLRALRERLTRALRGMETARAAPSGQGMVPEFDSHRPYAPGDDLRDIDWSLYARLDRFFVKSTPREEEGALHLLVDTSASMRDPFPEKRERALEVAGALAYLALCSGERVAVSSWADRLLSFGEQRTGEAGILPLLQTLAALPPGGSTDLSRALGDFLRVPSLANSRLVLLSDLIDLSPFHGRLSFLATSRVRLGVVWMLTPREEKVVGRGNLLLIDPETGGTIRRVVGYRDQKAMRAAARRHVEETGRLFAGRAERFLRSDPDRSFEEIVIAYLLSGRGRG